MSATLKILNALDNAPFVLYLGGSRRMSALHSNSTAYNIRISEDTDYDYYATHSEQAVSYLLSVGFKTTKYSGNANYMDSEAVSVYINGPIQVVLRKDAEFYRMVFESIPLEIYYHYIWKSSPDFLGDRGTIQPIFNALFAVAHAAKATKQIEASLPVVFDPIKAYEAAMKGIV